MRRCAALPFGNAYWARRRATPYRDLWEVKQAFASQGLFCRDRLAIDPERCNDDGGAIAVVHPYGMTGARSVGHALINVAVPVTPWS
jgi:hypothetical protein